MGMYDVNRGLGYTNENGTKSINVSTLEDVAVEVLQARAKFPGNRFLLAALMEEVYELAQAMLQGRSRAEINAEAIQVACVALRIFEEQDATFADLQSEIVQRR